MLLYNWFFILITVGKLVPLSGWGQTKRFLGMAILLGAISGAALHDTSRPGFYVSFGFLLLIAVVTFLMRSHWKGGGSGGGHRKRDGTPRIIGMDFDSPEKKSNRLKSKNTRRSRLTTNRITPRSRAGRRASAICGTSSRRRPSTRPIAGCLR